MKLTAKQVAEIAREEKLNQFVIDSLNDTWGFRHVNRTEVCYVRLGRPLDLHQFCFDNHFNVYYEDYEADQDVEYTKETNKWFEEKWGSLS